MARSEWTALPNDAFSDQNAYLTIQGGTLTNAADGRIEAWPSRRCRFITGNVTNQGIIAVEAGKFTLNLNAPGQTVQQQAAAWRWHLGASGPERWHLPVSLAAASVGARLHGTRINVNDGNPAFDGPGGGRLQCAGGQQRPAVTLWVRGQHYLWLVPVIRRGDAVNRGFFTWRPPVTMHSPVRRIT